LAHSVDGLCVCVIRCARSNGNNCFVDKRFCCRRLDVARVINTLLFAVLLWTHIHTCVWWWWL